MMRLTLLISIVSVSLGLAQPQNPPLKTRGGAIVLETARIEGKIKKPQVALISLERRPEFKAMALASLDAKRDIADNVDPVIFENRIFETPFPVETE